MSRQGWARSILRRTLADDARGRAIRSELEREHAQRVERDGAGPADGWLLRQAVSVASWSLRDRLAGRPWGAPGSPLGPRQATRDALRSLRRAPGYSLAVILTLGAAMAATVSVFTVVRGVLLRPLPYPDPTTLVRIDGLYEGVPGEGGIDYPAVLDWREGLDGLEGIAVWSGAEGIYAADGVSEVWTGTSMSPELLETVGIRPSLGSWYGPGEGHLNAMTIHLSHDLWERRFGADPDIVGKTIRLSDQSWVVQGVMPRGFVWPDAETRYWIPLRDSPFLQNRGSGFLHVAARLTPGTSLDAARAELARFTEQLRAEVGKDVRTVALRSVAEVERAPVARALWTLLGAVGLVLLVACANVSGLSLARTETRKEEWSIRVSLGAHRRHLVAGLVAESALLALAGGMVGLVGALAGVRGLVALAPADLPRREAVAMDPAVVAFAFTVSLVVGLLAGLLPGLRAARAAAPGVRRSRVAVALLGVYGVMAYSVATGLRRIGIQKALGAPAAAVGRGVLVRAAAIAGAGAVVGALASIALAPVLESMLYDVPARDPWTLAAVLTLAAGGALAAAARPARRAARVDPMRILREE